MNLKHLPPSHKSNRIPEKRDKEDVMKGSLRPSTSASRTTSKQGTSSRTSSTPKPIYLPSNLRRTKRESSRNTPSSLSKSSSRDRTQAGTAVRNQDSTSARINQSRDRLPPSNMVSAYPSISGMSALKSTPPSFAKSTLRSDKDQEMASRQTKIDRLGGRELAEQENWVQSYIKDRRSCPGGVDWIKMKGGYKCVADQHMMTNEIIREGKGGMFFLDSDCLGGSVKPSEYIGPYYLDTRNGKPGIWRLGEMKNKPKYYPDKLDYDGGAIENEASGAVDSRIGSGRQNFRGLLGDSVGYFVNTSGPRFSRK
ncbi:uncharacterized protein LY89DRAFT_767793 [Mollisia scopiformis]|uniref:Uncharacterized protein n=1 Tax=Mollisia scopiformis TaxID=149040 RepID=A0A194XPH8_MOLSC|nr:uncharacterized protein LY89DRAFT_767793 [Mollisia scopiformis]KUJ21642.1 hypothetical protein LY89DRAFT_767793 [Mollisia scopiformis]